MFEISRTRFEFFEPHDPVKRSSRVQFQIWLMFQVSWRQQLVLNLEFLISGFLRVFIQHGTCPIKIVLLVKGNQRSIS